MKIKLTFLFLTISLLGYSQSVIGYVGFIESPNVFTVKSTNMVAGSILANNQLIIDEENTSFSVYPNPFSEQAFLEYLSDDSYLVTIYDAKGKKVQEIKGNGAETTTIYRNSLAPGVYFVYLKENGSILGREKLIITD